MPLVLRLLRSPNPGERFRGDVRGSVVLIFAHRHLDADRVGHVRRNYEINSCHFELSRRAVNLQPDRAVLVEVGQWAIGPHLIDEFCAPVLVLRCERVDVNFIDVILVLSLTGRSNAAPIPWPPPMHIVTSVVAANALQFIDRLGGEERA